MRAMLIGLLITLSTSVPLANQAHAAPATIGDMEARTSMAAKLMTAMRLDRQFDAIIPSVVGMLMPIIIKGNEGKDEQLRSIVMDEMTKAFNGRQNDLIDSARDVYARNFSLGELSDMLVFYTSPTGRVFVEKMPTVTLESMQNGSLIGRKAAQDALPKIFDRMRAAQLSVPKGV